MQSGMMGGMHHTSQHMGHHPMSPMDHGVNQIKTPGTGASSHSPASTASSGSSSTTQNPATSVPPPTSSSTPSTTSPSSTSGTSSGQKRCGRPGCMNPVQGWANSEFCSNECVVGQCREVYTHWSSGTASGGNNQPLGASQQQYSASNGSGTGRTTTPVK